MHAEYLLRLDDACPTMDGQKWAAIESVISRHRVKPIVAVVPSNKDPGLARMDEDRRFWERARSWSRSGWMIALHGYSHELRPSGSGIVRLNRRSEFVGLPLGEQKRRLREGTRILREQGLEADAWVAPAHGTDRRTLEALRTETNIRIISDSFGPRPVRRWGFVWIPQQLWRPRVMPPGLWTICLHPNEMQPADMERLEAFIAARRPAFISPGQAVEKAALPAIRDLVFEAAFFSFLRMRRLLKIRTSG